MKEIFTAKSIEEAKHLAAEKFGVSEYQIVYRILEEPKKGLFGKIKREAQVEAVYEEPAAAAAPETPAETPAAPVSQPVQEAVSSVEEIVIDKDDNSPTRGMESEAIEDILTEENMTPGLLRARQYIADIYAAMGITVTITTMRTANGIRMELRSDNKSGTIIGRRGETLDSIQYLASILVNKDSEDYCRLLLDSNGYREKRRKTLEQLAEKIARSVLRSGRSTTLEPMNPYERRIIHSKISEIEGVTSKSVGEDPYRKVVVSSTTGRRSGGNRGGRGGQNRGGKRPYRERKPEDFQRKNLDSMKTSFERDYKKPKPEDELNAGLYGKIEF
ncbi:RNA-binding cell elongation regulator Jag/EloR [Ruminococcus sp.]|jgi:spoIIIJ-associated protein|uniref:RNA-binding cell elongation regulator Jag/EloR n=1 Tax=Ruminococcus sp. TaxID=41978 RepID=UPI0026763494|nr:RNA-binding cell elongation regulator Jag/EloR [uncultured Ruminococcus sp.]